MTVSNDSDEYVILVDESDRQVGTGAKLETHKQGLLHRAFSIFLFDDSGRTLIQKRAQEKYHSGGLWANTCCGHPRPGEKISDAAHRRLVEELGLEVGLNLAFSSRYKAELDHGMTENEYVHVFYGHSLTAPFPEPTEVADVAYVSLEELKGTSLYRGAAHTAWLRHYVDNHYAQLVDMQRRCGVATIPERSTSSFVQRKEKLLG